MWYYCKHFSPIFEDLLLKIWEIYQRCSNSVNFWARKMFFFFKWVRISPGIDWYHYQGASPEPGTYVHSPASNNDKDPYEEKCHIRAQWNPIHQHINIGVVKEILSHKGWNRRVNVSFLITLFFVWLYFAITSSLFWYWYCFEFSLFWIYKYKQHLFCRIFNARFFFICN